jgi:hypothetical protein
MNDLVFLSIRYSFNGETFDSSQPRLDSGVVSQSELFIDGKYIVSVGCTSSSSFLQPMNESRRIKRKLMFFIDLNLRVKALMLEYKKQNTFGIKGI